MAWETIISIIISCVAVAISIFGYINNKKNVDILMASEHKKEIVKEAVEILRNIDNSLKDFPHSLPFPYKDQAVSDIKREVYESDSLKLSINYENLKLNDNIISTNSTRNSKDFINKIRGITSYIIKSIISINNKINSFFTNCTIIYTTITGISCTSKSSII